MDFMCPFLLFYFACDDSWCSQNLVKVVVDLVTCGVYGGVIVNTKKESKKEKKGTCFINPVLTSELTNAIVNKTIKREVHCVTRSLVPLYFLPNSHAIP